MAKKEPGNLYGRRLRQARESYGYSETELGIAARLDESGAGSRISRYETGIHQPKLGLQNLIAMALALPMDFFYIENDENARQVLESCRSEEPALKLSEIQEKIGKKRKRK